MLKTTFPRMSALPVDGSFLVCIHFPQHENESLSITGQTLRTMTARPKPSPQLRVM
jgi:hypothetical protein